MSTLQLLNGVMLLFLPFEPLGQVTFLHPSGLNLVKVPAYQICNPFHMDAYSSGLLLYNITIYLHVYN